MTPKKQYETVIGLEVHVHLLTQSKIFCGCSTKFGAKPNTQTCPVCLGFPGVLPVFNREVLNLAIRVGTALECTITDRMKFDRKNYFYPDLPKNFQISQYDLPLAADGSLTVQSDDKNKRIRIKRVHLEEDAGKLIHDEEDSSSLVDFNRCGMPLLEIVSEPDISSPDEAYNYLTELKAILRYLGVSDCNMEEGSLRCDANISLRPKGQKTLGVKTELKNMNTFKGVKAALEHEVERQTKLLEEGKKIKQDTRLWNEAKGRTYSMRSKEEAFDYRYFPEPDLVPFLIEKKLVDQIRSTLPELPKERLKRFISDYKLSAAPANLLTKDRETADYFEECAKLYKDARIIANWIGTDMLSEANKKSLTISTLGIDPVSIVDMLKLIDDGTITGKIAKEVLHEMVETKKPPQEIVKNKGLSQIKDEGEIIKMLDGVIASNPKAVEDYKSGKSTAITFLVGQAMRATKGKANPKMVNELLKRRLDKI